MLQREVIARWHPGPVPFEVEQVLDFENGPTDLIVRSEDALFVLEMLAWGGPRFQQRVFRTSALPEDAYAVHQRNARSASCDLTRAGREMHALLTNATLLSTLLLVDVGEQQLLGVLHDCQERIPMAHWRDRGHEVQQLFWMELFQSAMVH